MSGFQCARCAAPLECEHPVRLEDNAAGLYVHLRCGDITRTVALSDSVYVDLDEHGNAIGVEVLR